MAEASRVEWLREAEALDLLRDGGISDGATIAALSYYFDPYRLTRRD